jgi:hypothetical protein
LELRLNFVWKSFNAKTGWQLLSPWRVLYLLLFRLQYGCKPYDESALTLSDSYVLQIAFTSPFLAILAVKILKHEEQANVYQLRKWVGIAFFGYVVALWANSVLRWIDMISAIGTQFFYSGINMFGALNAFVFMSSAVVFAALGAFCLARQKESAKKWLGLSLSMIGLHYTFYLFSHTFVGALNGIWLVVGQHHFRLELQFTYED